MGDANGRFPRRRVSFPNSYPYPHTDSQADPYAYACSDTDSYAQADADADACSYTDADACSYTDADADACSFPNPCLQHLLSLECQYRDHQRQHQCRRL
jgi:hypothetical protein